MSHINVQIFDIDFLILEDKQTCFLYVYVNKRGSVCEGGQVIKIPRDKRTVLTAEPEF